MSLNRRSWAGIDLPANEVVGNLNRHARGALDYDLGTRRLGITLSQISLFAAVAKHVSITKASLEFRVSQPWVSQQLKQLEDHYATKLYRKVGRGIEITDRGQLFLRNISPILDQVQRLESQFTKSPVKTDRDMLCVGGSFSACAALLPSLLARFRLKHPAVELVIRSGTSVQLERLLLAARLDLAVTVRVAPSVELVSEPLRREKIALFVPASHFLAQRKNLRLAEVLAEPLIVRGGRGSDGVTDEALTHLLAEGIALNIGMRCDGPTAIKAAVREKMGVGVVFADSIKAEVAAGEFKILDVRALQLEGTSYIIYPKNQPLTTAAREFLELLHSARPRTLKREQAPILATPKQLQPISLQVA